MIKKITAILMVAIMILSFASCGGAGDSGEKAEAPKGAFGRLNEVSRGKDTTTGHWELAGLVSEQAFPTYPEGFPQEVIDMFKEATGLDVLKFGANESRTFSWFNM